MKLSLNWINEHLDSPVTATPSELKKKISLHIAEVDAVYGPHEVLKSATISQIIKIEKHPNADKLNLVTVNDGKEHFTVVCGASNVEVGAKVPLVREGTTMPSGLVIKKTKIRGVESSGMLCSGQELGLNPTEGLLKLDEEIGKKLFDIPRFQDVIIEIDNKSLNHRPDLWGHYGFSREFAVIFSKKLKPLELYELPTQKLPLHIKIDSSSCYAYHGVHIENVNASLKTPTKIKNYLESVGQRSISLSVDLTNYVMLELGQPLHAFDRHQWKGQNIFVRQAKPKETITTLDGMKRTLEPTDMVIADDHEATALAGIMGGEGHSISDSTKEIILESANFRFDTVRRTSVRLGLRSESSARFEKTLHPELSELGAKRFCALLKSIDKNCSVKSWSHEYKQHSETLPISLTWDYLFTSLGKNIDKKFVMKVLEGLEFSPKEEKEKIDLKIPGFRSFKDIQGPHDIVEEVGRHFGYDNIEPMPPNLKVDIPDLTLTRDDAYDLKLRLNGFGYSEIFTYPMISKKDCDRYSYSYPKLEIANPMGLEYMRDTTMISMLNAAELNGKHFESFKFFEVGKVYHEEGEKEILSLVSTSNTLEFLKEINSLKRGIHLERSHGEKFLHPYVSFKIVMGKHIGTGGRIHPELAKELRIPDHVHFAFMEFSEIIKKEEILFKAPSAYPPVFFEVAVMADSETDSGKVLQILKKVDERVQNAYLLDEYRMDQKKSLAFKIIFQRYDRTFEPSEIEQLQKSVIETLSRSGFPLRT